MELVRALVASWIVAASAAGQGANARYEIGVRLRALDRAWLKVNWWSQSVRDTRREHALPLIEAAVKKFFAGDPGATAQALDDAREALIGSGLLTNEYDAFSITPAHRLCDAQEFSLRFDLEQFYRPRNWGYVVFTSGVAGSREPLAHEEFNAFTSRPTWTGPFELHGLACGDHEVWATLFDGDFALTNRTLAISIAEKLDQRLAALEKRLAELPDTAPRLERETAKALLVLLRSLASGSTEEVDYPAARLLGECEQVVAAAAKGERFYAPAHSGEFWLAVPTRKSAARVRVFVPADTKLDKPVPLVIALHGAGGSENMFFDTYGAGAVVKLCAERGWLLVAPRLALIGAPPLDAIVDALAERYPVDRSRLLVVGHSLGAAAGLNAVSSAPTKYRAFASLGSGQGAKDASTLAQLPIFVGIGESDFGRRGAESLHASLVAAGSTKATLTIYPKCEHLMVVADALPDVFRFFDEALTK